MFGAVIGDIVGLVYEWHNINTKDFPLFRDNCLFTANTVMAMAVADAIMNGGKPDDFIDSMKKFGRLYFDSGYGGRYGNWLFSNDREPYNSWGNGSAMKIGSCAEFAFRNFYPGDSLRASIDHARELAKISASITHNHV